MNLLNVASPTDNARDAVRDCQPETHIDARYKRWISSVWLIAALLHLVMILNVSAMEGVTGGQHIPASIVLGKGSGELVGDPQSMQLTCRIDGLGDYAENTSFSAAVFDFRLLHPQELPSGTSRVGLELRNPGADGKVDAGFRVLIGDSLGGEWAVTCFMNGNRGDLQYAAGFEKVESAAFNISELGRIDRWVMMSLNPLTFDEYTQPKAPLKLLGIRVIPRGVGRLDFQMRNLAPIEGSGNYDPCWDLSENAQLTKLVGHGAPHRFGWGAREPGPYLTPLDLGLASGSYACTWEITDLASQRELQSASTALTILPESVAAISFPLLPAGTYRLHLFVSPDAGKAGQEWFFQYVVYANSRGLVLPTGQAAKPLACTMPEGGIFPLGSPAQTVMSVRNGEPGDQIAWNIRSADRRQLANGSDVSPAKLDLEPLFAVGNASLWLEARLVRNGREVDVFRRVFGRPSAQPIPAVAGIRLGSKTGSKEDRLAGKFSRTKGDWHEGSTPIVSQHQTIMDQFAIWTDEAKAVGYNVVEYSATWSELEPLPGVYEFKYLDELVNLGKQRGLLVVLRVHPIGGVVPDWVPRETQRASDGRWHGIWGGNQVNSPGSEALNAAQASFLESLAAHYRTDPDVIGYTLSNVFFDHGFIDAPFTGQYTGFEECMRVGFCSYLHDLYGTLDGVSKAHESPYTSWDAIPLPIPVFNTSPEGRCLPRHDRLGLDYAEFKKRTLMAFRTRAIEALRRGDPACIAGPYSDNATALLEEYFERNHIMTAQGSMEDQYPPQAMGYVVRYEPHAKVARTARTTDIGMSNLLFYQPGKNTFFNYWYPQWTLDNVSPDIREAEARLKQWFACVDRLIGAKPIGGSVDKRREGVVIASLDTLLKNWQHLHTARIDDYLAPYFYRCKNELTNSRRLYSTEVGAALSEAPYVYVPNSSDMIDKRLANQLTDFVQQGGRLVIDGMGGTWNEDGTVVGSLRSQFALPASRTLPPSTNDTEKAQVKAGCILDGLPISFRTRQWLPPVESQPVAWIDTCARGYFLPARFSMPVSEGVEILATIDDEPVALLKHCGKGEIIVFAGTINWFGCTGLTSRLDNWGKRLPQQSQNVSDPEVLVSAFSNGGKIYAIGRRFIPHGMIAQLKGGSMPKEASIARDMAILFPGVTNGRWTVKELLSGHDIPAMDGAAIHADGISLSLQQGEAFVLELSQVP